MSQRISFYLDDLLAEQLKALDVSMSSFLRSAVEDKLKSMGIKVAAPATVSADQLQALADRVSALEASLAKHEKFCQQELDDMPELIVTEMVEKLKPSCFYHEE